MADGATSSAAAPPVPLRVAVIGAGFSGAMVAAHLLRGAARAGVAVRVALVAGPTRVGRGAAYGTTCAAHLLNVPAGRMSALPEAPDHFLRWARARDPAVSAGTFVPRPLYGEYVESVLAEAERVCGPGAALERVAARAVGVAPDADGAPRVELADGRALAVDRVVLAFGNFAPADPPLHDPAFYTSPRYVRDPWAPGALDAIAPDEPVLVLGTGLTMYDVAVALAARGHRGVLHAVSRRGLLPARHADAPAAPVAPPAELPRTARGLLHAVRDAARRHGAAGGDWRAVVDSLRAGTGNAWQALEPRERQRFLRHLRAFWDVHRHRAPPATADAVARMIDTGRLAIHAGRVVALRDDGDTVAALIRPRGGDAPPRAMRVGHVLNCTGPEVDLGRVEDPLIRGLLAGGFIQQDPLRLGLLTTDDGATIDRRGEALRSCYAVGPMRRAQRWEATAVPELREAAATLAQHLLATAPVAAVGPRCAGTR